MPAARATGFTLLEVLTVLVITGLLAAIAIPQMRRLAEAVEADGQRRMVRESIEELGYRAYLAASPITLDGKSTQAAATNAAEPGLAVPGGWQIRVSAPIRFAASGMCGGGRLAIVDPRGVSEWYVLRPPHCLLEPANAPE